MKHLKWIVFPILAAISTAVMAADESSIANLRAQDARLLRIVEPILSANAALCDRTMPDLGVALQSTDQYPADRQPDFAAPVAFAAVLPGSAAAQAGIERDDGLLAVDGRPIKKDGDLQSPLLRDAAFAAIAAHDPAEPLDLTVVHDGVQREVTLPVKPECRVQVEILDENGYTAHSDDKTVQIGYGLAVRATDDQIAVVFAHELSHVLLHHMNRLDAAGASSGVLGQLGPGQKLILRTEEEADRLSLYLLADAGIDPEIAPQFWRSDLGRRLSGGISYKLTGGIFHNLAHPSAKARTEAMEAEIAAHGIRTGQVNDPTALLATRTQPLN